MTEPINDPCSWHDESLKGLEKELGEFQDSDSNVVKLARMVQNLVTTLRQRERDRVSKIISQI
jgi:hypothetical protein